MSLRIINDAPGLGLYVGGFNICPEVALIAADSWGSAWELWAEDCAERGALSPCEHESEEDEMTCDSCEYVDGHGPMVVLDLVLNTVRSGPRD